MKDNSYIGAGHCASEWGGRETGKFLFTDDEVRELIAAERESICETIRSFLMPDECVKDDIDRMHNQTLSDVLLAIRVNDVLLGMRENQEPQG